MHDGPEIDLDPQTREVFDLLRRQAGDVFTVDALAERLGFPAEQITSSTATLERMGLAERAGDEKAETWNDAHRQRTRGCFGQGLFTLEGGATFPGPLLPQVVSAALRESG